MLDRLRHFDREIAGRPVLVPGPQVRGPLSYPPEYLSVDVALRWTDGHAENAPCQVRAWTATAVLVRARTSRGQYEAWVDPATISRS